MKKQHRPGPRTFTDKCWNHETFVGTGNFYSVWEKPDGFYQEEVEYEETRRIEHWGRKESCRLCARHGEAGEFQNRMTLLGWVTYIACPVLLAVALFATFFR